VCGEIKKTEIKKKEERRNKNRNGPRGNVSAQLQKKPAAHLAKPEPVPLLPSPLADWWDPHVSIITSTVSSLLSLSGNGNSPE
jgi:hypothetical protein